MKREQLAKHRPDPDSSPDSQAGDVTAFKRYISLGDSMSIDRYPSLDVTEKAGSVGRGAAQLFIELPLGAASLFYRNDPVYWPDFISRDLSTRFPKLEFSNLTSDGATIGDVFGAQLPDAEESEEATLVTLTVGGNDLLSAYAGKPSAPVMDRAVRDIIDGYRTLVQHVRDRWPNAVMLLTTVYDPTDGTGKLPGVLPGVGKLPLHYLDAFNDAVREMAAADASSALADVHRHFLGHGVTAKARDRWYWKHSLIEPSSEGANEIRRLWLDALDDATSR